MTKQQRRAAWTNRIIPLQNTMAQQIARQLLPCDLCGKPSGIVNRPGSGKIVLCKACR